MLRLANRRLPGDGEKPLIGGQEVSPETFHKQLAGSARGREHAFTVLRSHGERLFTQNVLARLQRRN